MTFILGYRRDGRHDYISRHWPLSVVSSTVHSTATGKLVCNKRMSILSEPVLTVLSHTEINSLGIDQRKVCINQVSIIIESIITKFCCSKLNEFEYITRMHGSAIRCVRSQCKSQWERQISHPRPSQTPRPILISLQISAVTIPGC